jgi:hypothetical protein
MVKREARAGWLRTLARVAEPRNAALCLGWWVIFAAAVAEPRPRSARCSRARPNCVPRRASTATRWRSPNFDTGLDWLTVVFEAAGRGRQRART